MWSEFSEEFPFSVGGVRSLVAHLRCGVQEPQIDHHRVEQVGPECEPRQRHPTPMTQQLLNKTPNGLCNF